MPKKANKEQDEKSKSDDCSEDKIIGEQDSFDDAVDDETEEEIDLEEE